MSTLKQKIKRFGSYLKNLLFPKHIKCVFCGNELATDFYNDTCKECLNNLPFIKNYCDRCGLPVKVGTIGVCQNCKTTNYNFNFARSVFEYKDKVVRVVRKLKYHNGKYLVESMANSMAELYSTTSLQADIVTNIPMHIKPFKKRGYNQSKLLAEKFASKTNLPCVELCSCVVNKPSQTSLSYSERKENVKDSFAFNKEYKEQIKDKVVLIIDDVITTGATTSEIAKVLIENGAKACNVLTFAHSVVEPTSNSKQL